MFNQVKHDLVTIMFTAVSSVQFYSRDNNTESKYGLKHNGIAYDLELWNHLPAFLISHLQAKKVPKMTMSCSVVQPQFKQS